MSASIKTRVPVSRFAVVLFLLCCLLSPAMGAECEPSPMGSDAPPAPAAAPNGAPGVRAPSPSVPSSDAIGALRKGARQAALVLGPGFGTRALGSKRRHDLALTAIQYSRVTSDVIGAGRWYRGNAELVFELFGGTQEEPSRRTVVGILPMLRYSFATGSRWVPFVTGGVGGAYTTIADPDLSGGLQFTVQVGAGTHYFMSRDRAITLQYRWFHLSNAGIRSPNSGLNSHLVFTGVSWLF